MSAPVVTVDEFTPWIPARTEDAVRRRWGDPSWTPSGTVTAEPVDGYEPPFLDLDPAEVRRGLRHRGESPLRWSAVEAALRGWAERWFGMYLRRLECDEVTRIDRLFDIAEAAGYRRLSDDEVQRCVGRASGWGVRLKIDFDAFDRWTVMARGETRGTRGRRDWRRGFRMTPTPVAVYGHVLVAYRHKTPGTEDRPAAVRRNEPDDETTPPSGDYRGGQTGDDNSTFVVRLFRNVPRDDVDMTFPTAKVRLSKFDGARILLPSLGGFLWSLRKVAQITLLLAALALHWSVIAAAFAITYFVKLGLSYSQTRTKYQLRLTQNLYLQKIAADRAVSLTIIDQAVRRRVVDATMAAAALSHDADPISPRKLRRRCGRWARETFDRVYQCDAAAALTSLDEAGLIEPDGRGRWRLLPRLRDVTTGETSSAVRGLSPATPTDRTASSSDRTDAPPDQSVSPPDRSVSPAAERPT